MNRILELFFQRAKPSDAERRRQNFFDKAPSLQGLHQEFEDAIESERDVKVSDYTDYTYLPDSLAQFNLISPADLTPDVLKCGARLTRDVAKRMGVRYTSNYADLVKRLHAANPNAIEHIHSAFISDLMAAEYVMSKPLTEDGEAKSVGWIFGLKNFTPGPLFLHTLVLLEHSVPPFSGWRLESLKDEVLRAIFQGEPSRSSQLCPPWLARQNLLESMISEGFFPKGVNGNTQLSVRIDSDMSIRELLTSHMKCHSGEFYEITCLRGLIKRHPIEAVVAAAQTPQLKRTLVDLYPNDVLLPHVKKDHLIKGLMIEEDLGL